MGVWGRSFALLGLGTVGLLPPDTIEPLPPAERVVVVGVAGLRWSDVTGDVLPHLAGLARRGSVGTLSVRSAPAVTCPADGWLTLGAGTYAAGRDPGGPDVRTCPREPGLSWTETVRLNDELRFGAEPGWLAEQLASGPRPTCVTAAGAGAALAAATPAGEVPRYVPEVPEDLGRLLGACPVTLVDAGSLPEGVARRGAQRRLDRLLARVEAALPPRTVLMVLGVAETDPALARLHAAVVTGPGFGPGYLWSASTRRPPYVQLVDVAPTLLHVLDRPPPDVVAGRPFTGGHPGRPSSLAATRAELADTDRQAVQQRRVLAPFFVGLTATVVAVAGALALLLARLRLPEPAPETPSRVGVSGAGSVGQGVQRRSVPEATRRGLRVLAVGLSSVPAAMFLANLVPWWRARWPLAAVSISVVGWAVAILAVAVLVARWRGSDSVAGEVRTQVGVVAIITVLVFAADALTGSGLQLGSLLGYNPVVAGRFTGFGNIAFAVFGSAAVIVAAWVAAGRPRARALAALAAVAGPVLILDGWPGWGADFGGVLTLVPTFVVLALLVTQTRLTWSRLVLAGTAGVVVVGIISGLDYLRPAGERSHFGRFLSTVLHGAGPGGDALATIERKLLTSWELLFMGPHTWAALGLTLMSVAVVLRPPPLLREACRAHPGLRPMLGSTMVLALVGLATNDSGVAIPAVVTLVTAPATLALCAATEEGRAHV